MKKGGDPRSQEFLDHVYRDAAVGLCYIDTEFRYQHINEWLAALNGLSVEAHLGKTVRDVVPHLAVEIEHQLCQVIETGEAIIEGIVEAETLGRPGERRTFSHNYHPVRAEDGSVLGVSCFVQDISDRRKAEDTVRRAADVFNFTGIAIVTSKPDGTIETMNPAALRMYQYHADTPHHLSDIYAKDELDKLKVLSLAVNDRGDHVFESKHRRADGTVFPVRVAATLVRGGEERGDFRIATIEDLSERQIAKKRQGIASWVVESVTDGIIVMDRHGQIQSANPAVESIFGYASDEITGRNVSMLMPDPIRGEHDQYLAKFMETGEAKIIGIGREIEGKHHDGFSFPAHLSVSEFNLDGVPMFVGVIRDKTEHDRLMAQIVESERLRQVESTLKEKEILLQEIHHRVKNNLQRVSSLLSLQASTEKNEDTIRALANSQRRVMAMARLHEALHEAGNLTVVDVRSYLNAILRDSRLSGSSSERVSFRLETDDILIDVDSMLACGQIISELLANSLKHGFPNDQSGCVGVSLHRLRNGMIELAVIDDGAGLPEDFDFEKTNTLGLRLVRALVMQLGGAITVDGSGGTAVRISFQEKSL